MAFLTALQLKICRVCLDMSLEEMAALAEMSRRTYCRKEQTGGDGLNGQGASNILHKMERAGFQVSFDTKGGSHITVGARIGRRLTLPVAGALPTLSVDGD